MPKSFLEERLNVSEKFGDPKNASEKGDYYSSLKNFVSHCKKTWRWNTSVFQKTCSMEKILWRGGWWGITSSCRNFFCMTLPKNFVWWPCNSYGGFKTFWCRNNRGIMILLKTFWSQSPKSFCREPFNVPENFEYRKNFYIRRGYHKFLLKFSFISQCRKLSWGNPSMFPKCSGIEKNYTLEGDITTFCWNIFYLTVPKNFVE